MSNSEQGARAAHRPAEAPRAPDAPSDAGFTAALGRYRSWCNDLAAAITDYQAWVEQQGAHDGEQDLRVYELAESLKSERLRVAIVGEISRGKTELLNALFFANFKRPLLPSAAGRTTMCPTELCFDENVPPCVRLLPIETRKTSMTITEYKATPIHWTTVHVLKPDSAEEMREAFLEVTRTKKVSTWEAEELGLYTPAPDQPRRAAADTMEIPVWRHAIINFPHPLLQRGLVVLDTPGLNTLGIEPELTFKMLPDAQAVLFVLAADAGVTRSDLAIWTQHIAGNRGVNASARFVVLNKVDILWDELRDENRVAAMIAQQVHETARTLNVSERNLFAISAQKALAGRARGDAALLARSGLPKLEQRLVDEVLPHKYEIIRSKVVYEISARVRDHHALLQSKLAAADKQLAELKQLGGRNADAIQKMVARLHNEKEKYDLELRGFGRTRQKFSLQAKALFSPMSLASLDHLIKEARRDMQECWTTSGLKQGMATFFAGASQRMDEVARRAEALKRDVEATYARLHTEYGFAERQPAQLSLLPYVLEFKRLEEKAEAFRTSPMTMMTEQRFVIKRFFITLVSQARYVFGECNSAAKGWFQALVTPLYVQLRDHKTAIEAQLETLRKIHKNMDTLGLHVAELEVVRNDLAGQLRSLDVLLDRIQQPVK